MQKSTYFLALAAAAMLTTGAVAQSSGPTGTSSPTGANSRAATSIGIENTNRTGKARKTKAKTYKKRMSHGMHGSMNDSSGMNNTPQ